MGLLSSGGNECYVCGKEVGDDAIEEDGHVFCCQECKQHYEDDEKPDEKEAVCEFC